MNANDLDRFATSLVTSESRRRLVRLLAALPVAGLLASHLPEAAAKHPKKHKKRKRHRRRHGGEQCDGISGLCFVLSPNCCADLVCTPSAVAALTSCQAQCESTEQCRKYGHDLECVIDPLACPFLGKCCRLKSCTQDADCPRSKRCCLGGHCAPTGGQCLL
jgi:hypothetical protein